MEMSLSIIMQIMYRSNFVTKLSLSFCISTSLLLLKTLHLLREATKYIIFGLFGTKIMKINFNLVK